LQIRSNSIDRFYKNFFIVGLPCRNCEHDACAVKRVLFVTPSPASLQFPMNGNQLVNQNELLRELGERHGHRKSTSIRHVRVVDRHSHVNNKRSVRI